METNPKSVTMTQIRREVSLDSQAGGGGSLANSRLTLSSLRGETPLSLKSTSFDLVDESVQVDLSADTITYDSDDEMVKKQRVSSLLLARNKKGHPVYSREDIREQYCINKKEVEVLESGRSVKFLGCFANSQESSPCSKNSLLFSCVQRKKSKKKQQLQEQKRSNSDENVYERSTKEGGVGRTSGSATPDPYEGDRTFDDDRKSTYEDRSTDDEDYISSGFKKRPRPVCLQKQNWQDSESIEGEMERTSAKRKLESSASLGSTSQQSYDFETEYARSVQRPQQLVIISRGRTEYFQPSRSVDELNDATNRRGTTIMVIPRSVKTPDISLEDRRPKHVSFDNGSLVRSNTIGGGMEDVAAELEIGPAATSTPLNTHHYHHQRRAFSPPPTTTVSIIPPSRNRSKERLLDRRNFGDISGESRISVSSSTMTNITINPSQNIGLRISTLQHRPRRSMMKTQATQTDLTFKDRFSLPAYLTLSPRAHKATASTQAPNHHHIYHPARHRVKPTTTRSKSTTTTTTTKLSKSRSAYGSLGIDKEREVRGQEAEDDDVMEIDLSGKQHRLLRSSTSRASIRRQRAFDTSQEEIMVSFKPVRSPPPIEVLLGDRPVPRLTDRKHATEISKGTPSTRISRREFQQPLTCGESISSDSKMAAQVLQKDKITSHRDQTLLSKEKQKPEVSEPKISKGQSEETHSSAPKMPLISGSSEEKPSLEDGSEVSGLRSSSGRLTGSKTGAEAHETSSAKSSSESSKKKNRTSQKAQIIPDVPMIPKLGETSTQSEESLTMTTEESLRAQEIYREKKENYMAKYQQHVSATRSAHNQENQVESPTSPDSESSSSIFTERETSRSEGMSTSSSCNNNHHDIRLPVTRSDSESSEYVTAPDHSHRDASIGKLQRTTTEETATTFESFSSPSSRSSLHPLQQQPHQAIPPQKSSTSPSSSTSLLPHDDDEEEKSDVPEAGGDDKISTTPQDSKMADFDNGSLLSPPAALPPPEVEEHQESSDESTKKETPPTSPSSETDDGEIPELRFSSYADNDIANAGTPDSDRTSDITPVFDASPEPLSSLLEDGVETVIEVRSENTATANTSDECLDNGQRSCSPGSQNNITSSSNNGDDSKSGPRVHTESESSESSSVLSGLQDMESAGKVGSGMDAGGNRIQIQLYQPSDLKPPDELSTVSEVSEESSQTEITADSKRKLFKRKTSSFSSASESNSHQRVSSTCSTGGEHGATRKSSSSEYIPSEATTPSFDSTTSGSFILENSSCSTCSNHQHYHSESCSTGKGTSECSSAAQEERSSPSESSKKTSDTPDSISRPKVEEEEQADASQIEKRSAPEYSAEEGSISEAKLVEIQVDVEPIPASVEKVSFDKHFEDQDLKTSEVASPTSSLTSEHSEKLVTASSVILSATSSSSSLTREVFAKADEKHQQEFEIQQPPRSHSVDEPDHSLWAWCSEGAIPKQKFHDGSSETTTTTTTTTTRRRKDRARMKSETKDLPAALQLFPSGFHRYCPRSKSHSPEKSDDDQDSSSGPGFNIASSKVLLCSHCGEKIKDSGPPMSAPPQGMWEVPYQRSMWEPPPSHHHLHQGLSWRQQQQQRGPYGDMYGSQGSSRFVGYGGPLPRSWSTECGPATEAEIYPDEDEDAGIHSESYRSTTWIYVSENDELAVWKQTIDKPIPPESEGEEVDPSFHLASAAAAAPKKPRLPRPQLSRSDSTESTSSEHEFLRQYQAVTHRMVHRKSSVEMYNRMASRTFEVDKRVVVQRNNGEFGFRIHGSKPVVVSAIEKGTPAETCGLEVGDIIVCINGLNVLDAFHSEVVRIAHTGTEVLKMEVTRTCHVLTPMLSQSAPVPVFSGFLQRLSARSVTGRRWCRRWFAVKEDGVLYWYRTSKNHEPLGALVLQNQDISWVPEAGSPHAFKVSKFGGCQHYFSADDEETATKWISALNQVASTASRLDPYLEQSMRQAQVPPSQVSADPADCQGYVAKLSQRWKTWRRRYFLLKDAALYFYVDRNAKVALGLFHLHGYKVQSCNLQGRKNTFEAIPPEPRLKHLYFQADSENEKKRWLAALEYSIDRWIKVG